ncbi:hypothetical protein B0H13DRAFT_2673507 [Mycena leptocephala]|nr:hypothetical protein B0H13DRAFT_2673507 [Mycena leptocephala]
MHITLKAAYATLIPTLCESKSFTYSTTVTTRLLRLIPRSLRVVEPATCRPNRTPPPRHYPYCFGLPYALLLTPRQRTPDTYPAPPPPCAAYDDGICRCLRGLRRLPALYCKLVARHPSPLCNASHDEHGRPHAQRRRWTSHIGGTAFICSSRHLGRHSHCHHLTCALKRIPNTFASVFCIARVAAVASPDAPADFFPMRQLLPCYHGCRSAPKWPSTIVPLQCAAHDAAVLCRQPPPHDHEHHAA